MVDNVLYEELGDICNNLITLQDTLGKKSRAQEARVQSLRLVKEAYISLEKKVQFRDVVQGSYNGTIKL